MLLQFGGMLTVKRGGQSKGESSGIFSDDDFSAEGSGRYL